MTEDYEVLDDFEEEAIKTGELEGEELSNLLARLEYWHNPEFPVKEHECKVRVPQVFSAQADIIEMIASEMDMPKQYQKSINIVFGKNPRLVTKKDLSNIQYEIEQAKEMAERIVSLDKPPRWVLIRREFGKQKSQGFGTDIIHMFDLNNLVPLTIQVKWDERPDNPVIDESKIEKVFNIKNMLKERSE